MRVGECFLQREGNAFRRFVGRDGFPDSPASPSDESGVVAMKKVLGDVEEIIKTETWPARASNLCISGLSSILGMPRYTIARLYDSIVKLGIVQFDRQGGEKGIYYTDPDTFRAFAAVCSVTNEMLPSGHTSTKSTRTWSGVTNESRKRVGEGPIADLIHDPLLKKPDLKPKSAAVDVFDAGIKNGFIEKLTVVENTPDNSDEGEMETVSDYLQRFMKSFPPDIEFPLLISEAMKILESFSQLDSNTLVRMNTALYNQNLIVFKLDTSGLVNRVKTDLNGLLGLVGVGFVLERNPSLHSDVQIKWNKVLELAKGVMEDFPPIVATYVGGKNNGESLDNSIVFNEPDDQADLWDVDKLTNLYNVLRTQKKGLDVDMVSLYDLRRYGVTPEIVDRIRLVGSKAIAQRYRREFDIRQMPEVDEVEWFVFLKELHACITYMRKTGRPTMSLSEFNSPFMIRHKIKESV